MNVQDFIEEIDRSEVKFISKVIELDQNEKLIVCNAANELSLNNKKVFVDNLRNPQNRKKIVGLADLLLRLESEKGKLAEDIKKIESTPGFLSQLKRLKSINDTIWFN